MDEGERGPHQGLVRLRVGAHRLGPDGDGEREGGEPGAAGGGAEGREDEGVGRDEDETALAEAVHHARAQSADRGEEQQEPGRGGRGEEGGGCGPGTGPWSFACERASDEFAEVHGQTGEDEEPQQRGGARGGYPELARARLGEACAQQGDDEDGHGGEDRCRQTARGTKVSGKRHRTIVTEPRTGGNSALRHPSGRAGQALL